MIGTYAAVAAVCVAALAIGQAAMSLCGARRWSWLSPAVGLALLSAICWSTVRLPGGGVVSAAAVLVLTIASLLCVRGRVSALGPVVSVGAPVGLIALGAASLPFLVEGHFGVLGTGFNPDMSQHLLATDRLAHGSGSALLNQGYPLGPHAMVVALHKGLGIGLVPGFAGLTMAVAVLAPLTALTYFDNGAPARRAAGALLIGLPFMVASYFAQGAFKEVTQALYLLAFVLALRESATPEWRRRSLRFVPASLLAVGAVYTYSFPGLIWMGGILVAWLALDRLVARDAPIAVRPALLALAVFLAGTVPELGRMLDFRSFETFDPTGPGLGNLFGQISPLEALGIWPSGDFRLAPGDGAVPGFIYYLAAAFAAALLIYGLLECWRRRELVPIAGVSVAAAVYALARISATPYAAAKAIEIAAPLATLVILSPLARGNLARGLRWPAVAYLLAAGGCSLLAFANAPVGPTSYSPALTGLRSLIGSAPTLVLASERLLEEEHGARYIAWELRGGRICVGSETDAGHALPAGIRFVIASDAPSGPPFEGLRLREHRPPYLLWERRGPVRGAGPCPLIAVRQARQGPQR